MPRKPTRTFSGPDDVRDELRVWLQEPVVSDREWAFLMERRYVQEVLDGERTVEELCREVQEFRRAFAEARAPHGANGAMSVPTRASRSRAPKPAGGVADTAETLRVHTLAELIAEEASTRPPLGFQVRMWRQNVLQGRYPLLPEDVDGWVMWNVYGEQDSRFAPGPTAYVEVALSWGEWRQAQDEGAPAPSKSIGRSEAQRAAFHYLRLRSADGSGRAIPTWRGGELESLRRLGDDLAAQYPWTVEDAVYWVLTGITPPVLSFTHTVRAQADMPALDRLVLQVDPRVSPAELAAYYARVRQGYWKTWGGKTSQVRSRPHDPRRLEMITFAAPRLASQGDTVTRWCALWHEWNAAHPERQYKSDKAMRLDYQRARRQLLGLVQHRHVESSKVHEGSAVNEGEAEA